MNSKTFFVPIIIIMVLLTAAFIVSANDEKLSIIAGPVFQTQDGFGDLPFVGLDAGLSINVYKNRNNHDLWIRMLFQRTWPFKLSIAETFATYVRSSLSLGPEFVFEYNDFLVGICPGVLYRITDYSDGRYVSEYGFLAEGFTRIDVLSWFAIQPTVDIKIFDSLSTLEMGVSLRCLLRL